MKKILIVEDDAKIRAALTIRLKAAGYQPSLRDLCAMRDISRR